MGYLIQIGVVTVDQRDSFYLLDGGRPYKDLTVQEFAAQQAAAEAEQSRVAFEAEWVAWLNETINPLIAVGDVAGVNAALAGKQF